MLRRQMLMGLAAGAAWSGVAQAAEDAAVETAVVRLKGPDGREFGCRFRWMGGGVKPLIVFSHGFGGNLDAFPKTSEAWARAGYAIAHPTHADSLRPAPDRTPLGEELAKMFQLRAQGGLVGERGEAFVRMLDDPAHLDGRSSDVAGVLAAAGGAGGLPEPLRGRIDTARMGMAGHSYGAYTSLALGGAEVTRNGAKKSFAEPRFAAFMPISAQGVGRMGLDRRSFDGMRRPGLWITGSKDFGAGQETPDWRLHGYEMSPPGDKYSLFVADARHGDFDDPPGGPQVGAALRSREIAFWDAYVRGDAAAKAALKTPPASPAIVAKAR